MHLEGLISTGRVLRASLTPPQLRWTEVGLKCGAVAASYKQLGLCHVTIQPRPQPAYACMQPAQSLSRNPATYYSDCRTEGAVQSVPLLIFLLSTTAQLSDIMDPLSVTASVLAILGAAGQVTKGLAKIRSIHNAPAELSGLINEVSDLRAIISQVATFSNRLEDEGLRGPVVALKSHLSRARDQLYALDNLINVELLKVRASGSVRLSRKAWIRLKPDIELMQLELRGIRVNIGIALGVVTS
jgi:hypothetical protein